MAIPANINISKLNLDGSKSMLDDEMMNYVAGGCGNCDFWRSYKSFFVAAAILTGYMNGFKGSGALMEAYMSIFGKIADTNCTDGDLSDNIYTIKPAYK